MRHLLRSRLGPGVLLLWALSLALTQIMADLFLPLPNLSGTSPLVALFLPAVTASAIAAFALAPHHDLERLSPRNVPARVLTLATLFTAATALLLLAAGLTGRPELALAGVRNLLAYVGIAYLAGPFLGPAGAATPIVAATLLCAIASPVSSPLLSWAISTDPSTPTWIAPLALHLAGLTTLAMTHKHR